jgi:hypothetical protein
MPRYEYACKKCHKKFAETLTIHGYDTKKGPLPEMQVGELGEGHRAVLRQDLEQNGAPLIGPR